MSKRRGIHLPGSYHHVMMRGNNRDDVFLDDRDRTLFLEFLEEALEMYSADVYAYCLMSNHTHLLVRVNELSLSELMRTLNSRYACRFNWRHDRVGHVFQGRFHSKSLDREGYIENVIRYIHLNPYSANLVERPSAYPWSSHNMYLGTDEAPWMSTEHGLARFGEEITQARKNYQAFVRQGVKAGSDKFHEEVILEAERWLERAPMRMQCADGLQFRVDRIEDLIALVAAEFESIGEIRSLEEPSPGRGLLIRACGDSMG